MEGWEHDAGYSVLSSAQEDMGQDSCQSTCQSLRGQYPRLRGWQGVGRLHVLDAPPHLRHRRHGAGEAGGGLSTASVCCRLPKRFCRRSGISLMFSGRAVAHPALYAAPRWGQLRFASRLAHAGNRVNATFIGCGPDGIRPGGVVLLAALPADACLLAQRRGATMGESAIRPRLPAGVSVLWRCEAGLPRAYALHDSRTVVCWVETEITDRAQELSDKCN